MKERLRAGVVGAGVFGRHHASKYALMDGIDLLGVYDPHPERAAALARDCGGRPFADLAALLAETDIVSIASPASHHAEGALAALAAGRHVYLEKPLATRPDDADAIVGAAAKRGLVVACGFLERALFEAIGLTAIDEPPWRMEAIRTGRPSPRNGDVSVVLDLMIHDIDLALSLAGSEPLTVEASTDDLRLDSVEAEVVFDSGLVASLRASRIAGVPERALRLSYAHGDVVIDQLGGTIANRSGHAFPIAYESFATFDALGESLAAFVASVRSERPRPLADAADGARALDLALAVERAVEG